jgi:acyl-CoA thioester hydrolase
VNNAQYLRLFEEARWEMITSRGYGLEEVRQTQVSTVILECSVRFKREIRLREKIIISTQVESISAKTLCLHHRILKEDGKVASESRFTLGCFDLRARKLISLEGDWLAAITGVRN